MKFHAPNKRLVDEASDHVVSACKESFGSSLECVILKGSAVKGDFIQGYSDFDFHVFLNPRAMETARVPKIGYALRFQKAFGHVRPADYGVSQFQIYFINSQRYPDDWLPPAEGTFKVVWGKPPSTIMEADDRTYVQQANENLKTAEDTRRSLIGRFVDKPDAAVPGLVRLVGTFLKGCMYSIMVLLSNNPKDGLKLRLDEMIAEVEKGVGSKGHFAAYFEQISDWAAIQNDADKARAAFEEGISALDEIGRWYNSR